MWDQVRVGVLSARESMPWMKSRMSEFAGIEGVGSGRNTQSCMVAPVAFPGSIVVMGVTAIGLGLGDGVKIGTGVGVGAADGIGVGVGRLGLVLEATALPGEKTTLKAAPEGTGVPLMLATNHFDAAASYSTLYSSLSNIALRDGGFTGNARAPGKLAILP